MAMLPRPRALSCAFAISNKFEEAFRNENIDATISAGLVFASDRVPLRSVMREAHSILDNIAKEENGKGSIAVSVLKGSGKYCQWVSAWEGLSRDESILLEEIAESLNKENELSKSFFYRMRELLVMLSGESRWMPGMFFELNKEMEHIDIGKLLQAEYLNAFEHTVEIDASVRKKAEKHVEDLLTVSRRHEGIEKSEDKVKPAHLMPAIGADGTLLIKFLSQKEVSE